MLKTNDVHCRADELDAECLVLLGHIQQAHTMLMASKLAMLVLLG
jgi:hypothetical protein